MCKRRKTEQKNRRRVIDWKMGEKRNRTEVGGTEEYNICMWMSIIYNNNNIYNIIV